MKSVVIYMMVMVVLLIVWFILKVWLIVLWYVSIFSKYVSIGIVGLIVIGIIRMVS